VKAGEGRSSEGIVNKVKASRMRKYEMEKGCNSRERLGYIDLLERHFVRKVISTKSILSGIKFLTYAL
jgi:hypothetical protein